MKAHTTLIIIFCLLSAAVRAQEIVEIEYPEMKHEFGRFIGDFVDHSTYLALLDGKLRRPSIVARIRITSYEEQPALVISYLERGYAETTHIIPLRQLQKDYSVAIGKLTYSFMGSRYHEPAIVGYQPLRSVSADRFRFKIDASDENTLLIYDDKQRFKHISGIEFHRLSSIYIDTGNSDPYKALESIFLNEYKTYAESRYQNITPNEFLASSEQFWPLSKFCYRLF